MQPPAFSDAPDPIEDRRKFLLGCGSLGRAEPPTTTLLASTTPSYFIFYCSAVAAGKPNGSRLRRTKPRSQTDA
jgi:hypothetical protein